MRPVAPFGTDDVPELDKPLDTRKPGARRKSVRVPLRSFLHALLANERSPAMRIASEQRAALCSIAAVFAELIHPAQYEIGELWYQGKIGIADEHRATAIVEAIVDELP